MRRWTVLAAVPAEADPIRGRSRRAACGPSDAAQRTCRDCDSDVVPVGLSQCCLMQQALRHAHVFKHSPLHATLPFRLSSRAPQTDKHIFLLQPPPYIACLALHSADRKREQSCDLLSPSSFHPLTDEQQLRQGSTNRGGRCCNCCRQQQSISSTENTERRQMMHQETVREEKAEGRG